MIITIIPRYRVSVCNKPQNGLLYQQNITSCLFDFFANVQNILTLFSENSVHLSIITNYNLVLHLKIHEWKEVWTDYLKIVVEKKWFAGYHRLDHWLNLFFTISHSTEQVCINN